jgi:nucleotide-binding universal stress UspA family protein
MSSPQPSGNLASRILLVTQGTKYDAAAEHIAIAFARATGGRLNAVFPVVSNPEYVVVAPELAAKAEAQAAQVLAKLNERAAADGVAIDARARLGEEPVIEILNEARERHANLVVIRNRGKRGVMLRLLVGDIAAKVIGHAKCNVLAVPEGARMWGKRLLLATDGSRYSAAAAAAAGTVARAFSLAVTVITAVEESQHDQWQREADAVVKDAVARLSADGVTVDGRVISGRPHEALIREAKACGAELIVAGSHGRTGLEKVLMGSTTERIVGLAACPVLVVKPK